MRNTALFNDGGGTAFYKKPEFGSKAKHLENQALYARRQLEIHERQAEKQQREAEEFYRQASQIKPVSPEAPGKEYLTAYAKSKISSYKASQAGALLEPYRQSYQNSMKDYDDYLNQQQDEYKKWRSTIRSPEIVGQELEKTKHRVSDLKELETMLQRSMTMTETYSDTYTGPISIYQSGSAKSDIEENRKKLAKVQQELQTLSGRVDLLTDEADWSTYYSYADLQANQDFKENSGYETTANGKKPFSWDGQNLVETGFDDYIYDFINKNPDAADIQEIKADAAWDWDYMRQMNPEEISIFNYLYKTRGKEQAYQYVTYLESDLNARQRREEEQRFQQIARENPFASSTMTVLAGPAKAISYAGQAVDLAVNGKVDQNASYNRASYLSNAVRGAVADTLERSGKWGKVGSFAYQTGMSMADFLFNTAISGGNHALPLAIMGTGAAADATVSAKDRGLTDKQAFTLGTVAGLAEIITEKISLETLLNPDLIKNGALKYIGKNILAEGSEEAASDVINLFADILVAKDKSQWNQAIQRYRKAGKSQSEAFALAMTDQAAQMGLDFLGGAISGGIMSSVGAAGNQVFGADQAKVKRQEQVKQDLLQKMNPIETKILPTANDEWKKNKIMSSTTTTQSTGYYYDVKEEIIQQADRLSRLVGKEIAFYDEGGSEAGIRNGYYDPKVDTIYVNARSQNPTAQIVGHELTHSTELSDIYESLSNLVLNRIKDTGGDLEQQRTEIKELYKANGVELTAPQVDQELVAAYAEHHLLTDEAAITDMVQKSRTIAQRIKDKLDQLLAKLGIRKAQEREFIRSARDLYQKCLTDADQIRQAQSLNDEKHAAYVQGRDAEGDRLFDQQWNQPGYVENLLDGAVASSISKPAVSDIRAEQTNEAETAETHQNTGREFSITGNPVMDSQGNALSEQQQEFFKDSQKPHKTHSNAYWYPSLNKKEWNLLNAEITKDHSENQLDSSTNWFYTENNDTSVFCIYSTEDDGTVLYASGGRKASYNNAILQGMRKGENYGATERNAERTNQIIQAFQSGRLRGNRIYGFSVPKRGRTGNVKGISGVYGRQDNQQGRTDERNGQNRSGVKYSINNETENSLDNLNTEQTGFVKDLADRIPVKAADYVKRTQNDLLKKIRRMMEVPYKAGRETLLPVIREITNEYLLNGTIDQNAQEQLFEKAYDAGLKVDTEYYNTFKDVKDFLRTTAVSISEKDRENIKDFNDWRKSTMGTLRIAKNGTPADSLWLTLQDMAPGLFPEDITHPADQLVHMYEVARGIQKVEKSLDQFYGPEAEEFKRWARADFDAAVSDAVMEMQDVRRFLDDKKQDLQIDPELTVTAVTALYPQLKETRRNYEKVNARNLLTEEDQKQVQRLLRGDIQPEHLNPEKDNIKGILAVYEAKAQFEEIARQIKKWNKVQKAKRMAEAEDYTKTAGGWKDKSKGILYQRETMERNIRDIIPDKTVAEKIIENYLTPVHQMQAEATKMKNQYRDQIRNLGISRAVAEGNQVSEAYAVQLLGEAEDNIRVMEESNGRIKFRDGRNLDDWKGELENLWEENPNLDPVKIRDAVRQFHKIYDELFRKMNEVRIRNGYEPVSYRRGYFPHFQQEGRDGIMALMGKALGIDTEVTALPTTINGLTHTFKPGIRWMGNALERKGGDTAYDAVEGFDRYLEGAADVIYHTDNIQKLRALASQIRYRTSEPGIRKQIDEIRAREDLSDTDKELRIREIYDKGKFELSNFVVELEEYTNLLANKKSRDDRNMEQKLGRDAFNIIKALESRVAANMVAINPASWLTNFIPITQGWAALDTRHLMNGMLNTLKAYQQDDGMVDLSTFLINRRGSDPIVKTWQQDMSAKLSTPMEWIDNFTADSLIRARYQQNMERGLSQTEAISEADAWAAGVMADRSKGAMPTLFLQKNPITKLFTQFQLEVNNQLSYVFKDIPRELKEKGTKVLAAALLKFALGAWLFDEVYEYFIGRRPALDPIGMLNDTIGDLTGYEMPNLLELTAGTLTGNMPSFRVPRKGLYGTVKNLAVNTAEELPFIGGVLGGGRIPISSALPNADNLLKAATDDSWSVKKRFATAAKELGKPATYLIPPYGGGQLKKIYQAIKGVAQKGRYSLNTEGKAQLQYPIYADNWWQTAYHFAKAATFGPTSLRTGQEWIEGGFGNFTADQTEVYKGMMAAGVTGKESFDLLKEIRGAKKTETESAETVKRNIVRESDIPDAGKAVAYYGLMASDAERKVMDQLDQQGIEPGTAVNLMIDLRNAKAGEDQTADGVKRQILTAAEIPEGAKQTIYHDMMASDAEVQLIDSLGECSGKMVDTMMLVRDTDGTDRKIELIAKAGLSDQESKALTGLVLGTELKTDKGNPTKYADFINATQNGLSTKEALNLLSQGVDLEDFGTVREAGASPDLAADYLQEVEELIPEEGEESVQDVQKWRAAIDVSVSPESQLALLSTAMTESTYAKVKAGYSLGVEPAAYVRMKEVLPQFDANGSGSYNQDEITAAINSICTDGYMLPGGDHTVFTMSQEQKAVLWQMWTTSKSSKNNPFSKTAGQSYLDAKG